MNKKDSIKYIRKSKGYLPYSTIFEFYEDTDEVPQELIDLSCKKDEPAGNFIICCSALAEHLNKIK